MRALSGIGLHFALLLVAMLTVSERFHPNSLPCCRLVFTSNRDSSRNLYLMDADGSNLRQLTFGIGTGGGPRWSPDGDWIRTAESVPSPRSGELAFAAP